MNRLLLMQIFNAERLIVGENIRRSAFASGSVPRRDPQKPWVDR